MLRPKAIACGDARAQTARIMPASVDLALWSPPYLVDKPYERDMDLRGWTTLTARAMAELRIRNRRRKPYWSWIDPDPRAWERNTTWRPKLSPKGITTMGGDDDRNDEPRKPRLTEWGKQVLAKTAAETGRAARSVRMPATPAPAGTTRLR